MLIVKRATRVTAQAWFAPFGELIGRRHGMLRTGALYANEAYLAVLHVLTFFFASWRKTSREGKEQPAVLEPR